MINVFDSTGKVIARVNFSNNLDTWNGRSFTCGSTGRHKGIARLSDGQFVLIHGTQWQGEESRAVVVSPYEALQEIIGSNNDQLLEDSRFSELTLLMDEMFLQEA
jgi:hypothetical protein